MNKQQNWHPSYPFLGLCIVLLATVVFLVGTALLSGAGTGVQEVEAADPAALGASQERMRAESRPIQSPESATLLEPTAGSRSLDDAYTRRAYPGAPPPIPHAVEAEGDIGAGRCVACHGTGGYATAFEAFAPATPHPEFQNCRQCHVAQQNVPAAFAGNSWVKVRGPGLGQAALPGGPPRIPHALQLRENCVTCHGGPAAIPAIASGHPERGNCRQCHLPQVSGTLWSRPE